MDVHHFQEEAKVLFGFPGVTWGKATNVVQYFEDVLSKQIEHVYSKITR